MPDKVTPRRLPHPRTAVGWDGTDFFAIKVDSEGRLKLRAEDQLHSFKGPLRSVRNHAISGAGGFCNSNTPAAGEVWVVTSVSGIDMTTATTGVIMMIARDVTGYYWHEEEKAKGSGRAWTVQCEKHLVADDFVQVHFIGGLAGDECWVTLTGHIMTLET